jgi:hypothetical protein
MSSWTKDEFNSAGRRVPGEGGGVEKGRLRAHRGGASEPGWSLRAGGEAAPAQKQSEGGLDSKPPQAVMRASSRGRPAPAAMSPWQGTASLAPVSWLSIQYGLEGLEVLQSPCAQMFLASGCGFLPLVQPAEA